MKKICLLIGLVFLSSKGISGIVATGGGPPPREQIQLEAFHYMMERIDQDHEVAGERFRIITADIFNKRILMQNEAGSQLELHVADIEILESGDE